MNHECHIEEDEIDLKELVLTLLKWKKFIIIFTIVTTVLSIIYVLTKTPIYEVTSNVQIGYIGKNLVNEPDTIAKVAKIVFKVNEKHDINDTVPLYVSNISLNKKIKNFISIKSDGVSNKEALDLNKKVVKYIQNMYKPLIEEFIKSNKIKIGELERKIYDIDHFKKNKIKHQIEVLEDQDIAKIDEKIKKIKGQDIVNLKQQINLLKTQDIAKIDEKIKKIKGQDIVNLKQQINLLKTQDIAKIDEKIDFLKNIKIKTLQEKIRFHKEKLLEYSKAIKKIYNYNKNTKDKATLSIASMQIVNYQNLILNSQNKIEDFKEAIEKIKNETIPNLLRLKENIADVKIKKLQQKINNLKNITIVNLLRQKKNIEEVEIKNLQQKINNLKNITIVNLLRQKKNIENIQIKQLEYQLNIDLPNQKVKLQDQIEKLEFNNTKQYIQNSHIVGDYVVKNYPIKPKKKLIVIVTFITSLILSIFLVFMLEFFKEVKEKIHEIENKEEDKK